MTITEMVQNQQQQRGRELAQKQSGKPHVNPYGTPGMSLNNAGDFRKTVAVDENVVQQVAYAAVEYEAGEIVVGHPLNMNGSAGPRAKLCEAFAEALSEKVSVPVRLWDERGTTVSAIGYLNETDTRGKKRKEVVDAVAATIILESYLNYRRNHPETAGRGAAPRPRHP